MIRTELCEAAKDFPVAIPENTPFPAKHRQSAPISVIVQPISAIRHRAFVGRHNARNYVTAQHSMAIFDGGAHEFKNAECGFRHSAPSPHSYGIRHSISDLVISNMLQ